MILQELCGLYQRMADDPDSDVPDMGWSIEKVVWEIIIRLDGTIVRVLPLVTGSGNDAENYLQMQVPMHEARSSGAKPYFCCDNASRLFGKYRSASRELHEQVLRECNNAEAQALLLFFRPDNPLGDIDAATVKAISDGGLMVFRLLHADHYIHDIPAVQNAWKQYYDASADARTGFCSVTGERAPLARLFLQISGLPGAQSSGASLVSFNFDASESYGAKKTHNASLSIRAAFESGTMLKMLLGDRKRRISFGNTFVIFWANRSAPHEESVVLQLLGGRLSSEDELTLQKIEEMLRAIRAGKTELPYLDFETHFCILGISPNASRLSVRFFYQSTFGDLVSNYGQYLEDIGMTGVKSTSLGNLLKQLAPEGKQDKIPSTLISRSFSALVSGEAFPEALEQLLLMRMRADHGKNNSWDIGQRASLLKGCLVRKRRKKGVVIMEENRIDMELNAENQSIGYLLGRLFAVLERTQIAALDNVNASIRDKYIGAAATTPARVFSTLLRGYETHLSTLRKKDGGAKQGLASMLDRELNTIVAHISTKSPALPKTLSTDEQAEFYIAFHQEQAYLWQGKGSGNTDQNDTSNEEE